ncbi:hypothetical protein KSS87_013583 [Heliosperma pusillum]|nr:hypothetical protein KSS87_013583 [Heliosperma pusillum]
MSNSTMLRASKLIRHSSPSSLPDELLFDEILIRLPLLCLVRFKSVSKSWSSYLSTPKFMAAYHERHHRSLDTSLVFELYKNRSEIHHYTYNINDNTLFTQITNLDLPAMLVTTLTRTNNNNNNKYYNSRLSRSSLKKKKEVQSYEVVGYCDGIMGCLLPVNRTDTDPYTEKMILWDLTLGKTTLTLPSSYNYFSYGMHGGEDIIFGIGYDNKASHDYKVIRAAILPGETSDTVVVQANVYSLGLNTWTSFEATLPRARVRHGQGVHVNGVLYWSLGNDYCSLLSFCLVNQVFDRVPLLKDMIKQGEHPDDVDVFGRLINLKDRALELSKIKFSWQNLFMMDDGSCMILGRISTRYP